MVAQEAFSTAATKPANCTYACIHRSIAPRVAVADGVVLALVWLLALAVPEVAEAVELDEVMEVGFALALALVADALELDDWD